MARQKKLRYSVSADFAGDVRPLFRGLPEKYAYAAIGNQAPTGMFGDNNSGRKLSAEDIRALIECLMGLDIFKWARKRMREEMGGGIPNAANPVKPAPVQSYARHKGECLKFSQEAARLQGDRRAAAIDRLRYCELAAREEYSRHQDAVKPLADKALALAKARRISYEEAASLVGLELGGVIG